jgi:hypothetical protein
MTDQLVTQEFEFLDHKVLAVWYEKQWMFSPRRFCENWGISWSSQLQKIKKNADKYNCVEVNTVGKDGRRRKMLLIPASRANTWMLDIEITNVRKVARPLLQRYRDELSDWLYAKDFLTREEQAQVLDVARERGAIIPVRLSLDEKLEKVLGLPDETFAEYKLSRAALITDVMIGKESRSVLGEPPILTPRSFYVDYHIKGLCNDLMVLKYVEFATPMDVEDYAQQHVIIPNIVHVSPLSFTMMAQLTKEHKMFHRSIDQMVSKYNMPAILIHQSIQWIEQWLIDIFGARKVKLEPRTKENRKMVYDKYILGEDWNQKRDPYFSVYNCCIDCPPEKGWEVVSKNFNAHHLHYMTLGEEHPDDLIPLCVDCHLERERKRGD